MTRKDYILIAEALRRAAPNLDVVRPATANMHMQHEHDCQMVANALAADNAAFDRARFLKACGVQS